MMNNYNNMQRTERYMWRTSAAVVGSADFGWVADAAAAAQRYYSKTSTNHFWFLIVLWCLTCAVQCWSWWKYHAARLGHHLHDLVLSCVVVAFKQATTGGCNNIIHSSSTAAWLLMFAPTYTHKTLSWWCFWTMCCCCCCCCSDAGPSSSTNAEEHVGEMGIELTDYQQTFQRLPPQHLRSDNVLHCNGWARLNEWNE